MKRIIGKFNKDVKGSVSIFFILITALVFAFNAVLIDYARILAAEQQTEYAIQSAVRSSLASYDNGLREYGLFGIDEGTGLSDFDTLVKENIETPADSDALRFIDTKVESSEVELSRELAHIDMLEHQILEEMKYKAPVEIVKELIEKFTFVSSAMKETSTFINTASEIQDDFEKRENELDDLEDLLQEAKTLLNQFKQELNNASGQAFPAVDTYMDIIENFADYEGAPEEIARTEAHIVRLEVDIERLEEKIEAIDDPDKFRDEINDNDQDDATDEFILTDQQIRDFLDEIDGLSDDELDEKKSDLEDDIDDKEDEIDQANADIVSLTEDVLQFEINVEIKLQNMDQQLTLILEVLDEAKAAVDEADQLNTTIKNTIEDNRDNADASYGDAVNNAGSPPGGVDSAGLGEVEDTMKDMSQQLDEYVYKESENFFSTLQTHIEKAIEEMNKVKHNFDTMPTLFVGDDPQADLTAVEKVKDDSTTPLTTAINEINDAITFMSNNRKDFTEQPVEGMEDMDPDQQNENARQALETPLEIANNIAGDAGVYQELGRIFGEVQTFNQNNSLGGDGTTNNAGSPGDPEVEIGDEPEDSAKDAMRLVDSLFSGIGSILESARNELYVNEYILMYFESAVPTGVQNTSDYMFDNREVEYILYGIEENGANYAAALSQLFAVRFALNFIDAFADGRVRAAGHPLAVFIAALGYALKFSIDDVNRIGGGFAAPLIRNLTPSIRFAYHDYLRLFLFMNPSGENRLMRIATVIEYRGTDLTERQTYASGSVTTSVDLWFVPQLAQALGVVGVLDGEVEGNRYEFEKEANFSY